MKCRNRLKSLPGVPAIECALAAGHRGMHRKITKGCKVSWRPSTRAEVLRTLKKAREKHEQLVEAVRALYYRWKWIPAPKGHTGLNTGPTDAEAAQLWEAVRDAAGFEPGKSPK
jgi:hypothetical protein